ncbi:glycosyltransferase [Vibrio sp. 10N.222.55.A3]|uniref:glycosyltransferase n=1 Tax=unclassified Vibrio TaxID=2614977 RepID=UPI001E451A19|nr:glycosyltransferase [Vibrio sp. F13]MCC4892276.1 glycosyltransferase [Vibrio sp. F13]
MKTILISSFDMEIGGVERSLASMLANFDYGNHKVDLHLHSHTGPLMDLIDGRVNLLPEINACKTFRKGIKDTLLSGYPLLAAKRLFSRVRADQFAKATGSKDAGYFQVQTIWDGCVNSVPSIDNEYDVAISYLWPHHFTAFNVKAKTKIAWIHTDYSTIDIDVDADLKIWRQFDCIVSISDACTAAFLTTHPSLKNKVIVVENLTSPEYVRKMANEPIAQTLSEGFNLLSVGRLCDPKAFDRAVDVLAVLHYRGYANINWYIVGEGGDRGLIEEKIKQHALKNSFILLGSTTNPYPYMHAADIYMQPSRYEGKAVTVGEALILAKPVIITNYPTASSQIEDGLNGIICGQSVNEIADSIEALYKNQNQRQQLSAYNKNANHSNADELYKLYKVL